ncbi:MAG: cupin domain-containing protein [Alphaproteobacteria bacterium]
MRHTLLTAVALCTFAGIAVAPAMEMHQDMHKAVKADAVQWGPAPPQLPKGAQVAVMAGNPTKKGLYIIRAKMPDGYEVPAHWHKKAENVTVISGTFNVGMGDKLDKSKADALGPGGFFSAAPKMRHYAWATGETVIEVSGMGPFDITYVDPKDDPSRMAKMQH